MTPNVALVVAILLVAGGTTPPPTADKKPANLPPAPRYDGEGRYAMDVDDGVRGVQGLTELARRFGAKPYRDLLPLPYDGSWQTERVIFRDVATGATIVRLTNDPWPNTLSYFKGNWSADGRYVVFRRQPGMWENSTATHGPMVVRSDGTGLRNVFRQYQSAREHVCSPVTPNLCFAMADGNQLVAFDLKTGGAFRTLRDGLGCWRLKISPDGKYLLGRSQLADGRLGLWIVSSNGAEAHTIAVPESIHDSYRFHPAKKKIMFWYEDRFGKEGFVQCDFDGRKIEQVPVQFDWNHGDMGIDRGAHTNGFITRITADGWRPLEQLFDKPSVEYYDVPLHYNGYLTWMPKDQFWVYATRVPDRPHLSEIQSFPAEPAADNVVNRFRVCYTGMKRSNSLDSPDASPDGTKVLFNSNTFGRVDVYYVVARLPERPTGLMAESVSGSVRLNWHPPAHRAEIAGYQVFRSATSGVGFVPITSKAIVATEFVDHPPADEAAPFYAVSAVEHSGLESGLSEEATPDSQSPTKRHVFIEAEDAQCGPKIWKALDGQASNLHFLWMRSREDKADDLQSQEDRHSCLSFYASTSLFSTDKNVCPPVLRNFAYLLNGNGDVSLTAILPRRRGPCEVWARVKGEYGVQFSLQANGKTLSLDASPARRWRWMKFAGTLPFAAGKNELTITSKRYGSAVDCLVVTDDGGFSPSVSPRIRWPELPAVSDVQAQPVSPYAVKLKWQRCDAATFHHYNLYCSRRGDFQPQQRDLVASPDRNSFCDWGLAPGETLYYRVTCVDRAGNESTPSAAIKVALPHIDRVVLEKPPGANVAFDVPKNATYVLWLKLKRQPGDGQYITVKMDAGQPAMWNCIFDGLSDEAWFTYDEWARFALWRGKHWLALDNKTAHVIDKIILTNDLSYKPEGHVNILSGW